MSDLAARIERLEAIETIRALAVGYALAVDARDLDALVALYVADVRVGAETGRAALKTVFDRSLRQFTTSVHLVGNHAIEFVGPDDALGLVCCRIEHEVGDAWVTAVLLYHDRYARREGRWLFRGRVQTRLYATAAGDPPVGRDKIRWPGGTASNGGFHDALPSWRRFWESTGDGAPAPADVVERLVTRLRGSAALPKPPPYILTDP